MSDTTWRDVAAVLVKRWPAGPSQRGWEHEQVAGFIEELQVDKLTAHWALVGLRASGSAFIPSVGEVRTLAREAMPPMTAAEIEEAGRRMIERRRGATPELGEG